MGRAGNVLGEMIERKKGKCSAAVDHNTPMTKI